MARPEMPKPEPVHPSLLDLDLPRLEDLAVSLGEPNFRGRQLWQWLHDRRAPSLEAMANLPKDFRARLAERFAAWTLTELAHRTAADGLTEKWLYAAADEGQGEQNRAAVETVLIREQRERRRTVCVSCMAGCPLECAFCATGLGGFERNLTRGEILEQVYRVDAACRKGATTESRTPNGHADGV